MLKKNKKNISIQVVVWGLGKYMRLTVIILFFKFLAERNEQIYILFCGKYIYIFLSFHHSLKMYISSKCFRII